MAIAPSDMTPEMIDFVTERHLATLTLVTSTGEPHVSPVGFTWDPDTGLARVITWAGAKKVRHLANGPLKAVLCQVDGGRWLAFHGPATVTADVDVNADAERRYAERYRPPGDRGADRRTIEVAVEKIVGRA